MWQCKCRRTPFHWFSCGTQLPTSCDGLFLTHTTITQTKHNTCVAGEWLHWTLSHLSLYLTSICHTSGIYSIGYTGVRVYFSSFNLRLTMENDLAHFYLHTKQSDVLNIMCEPTEELNVFSNNDWESTINPTTCLWAVGVGRATVTFRHRQDMDSQPDHYISEAAALLSIYIILCHSILVLIVFCNTI